MSCIWTYTVLLLDLFTLQRPVLHPDMSTLGPELHLDVSYQQVPVLLTVQRVRFASEIICLLSDVFALL